MSTSPSRSDVSVGNRRRLRIAIVSDFYYPNMGGVEMHMYQLATCLIKRGHKVIVVTHAYGDRKGIRFMTSGIKVYYLPQKDIYNQSTLPTGFLTFYFPLLRKILVREQIDIVHGHGAFSVLCLEGMALGRTMGYKTCFTDHSLFGFADASSIHTNKLLKFALMDAGHVICVSHTSKENTVLRAALDPSDVSVIPNAIDATKFIPDPSKKDPTKITVVIISRMTYRKGVDLMIEAIPEVCKADPRVHFLIGGDGPMLTNLEEMRDKCNLNDRIKLLGGVRHEDVRNVLVQGDIFLNCSLTEAFCIAVVEAVSCGLLAVATKVGGVPEILPNHLIKLAEPHSKDVAAKLIEAIQVAHNFDPWAAHNQVKNMYSWHDVAERTEVVYDRLMKEEHPRFIDRFRRYHTVGGLWAGKLWTIAWCLGIMYYFFLEWFSPRAHIEIAPDFPFHAWPLTKQSAPVKGTYSPKESVDVTETQEKQPTPKRRGKK